ncbi:anti-sigma factor family protein [Shouchella clausii]|uniref:anti-sigma factor family protein n=1 Tax=Shouchella clausii TaxID=79880 RepID=UPI0007977B57|nr:anti-sigma factor [Shouchella clausii]KKI85515.1 anti-sigma W factor [Shouchella clausii]
MKTCHSHDELIHIYLDGDATKEQKEELYAHLQSCPSCREHLQELKKSIAFIQSSSHIEAPEGFTAGVMAKLPKTKKTAKWKLKAKRHPILVAAAIFLIMMSAAFFSAWNHTTDGIAVSGNGPFVIDKEAGVVVVPEGEVIDGDLVVRNGTLVLEGEVRGNVLLINSRFNKDTLYASPNQVTGEIEEVDKALSWAWYNMKEFFSEVVAVFDAGEDDPHSTDN